MIAKCDFTEMRRMLAGPEMAAILVKGWPNIQWKIAKSVWLCLKYLASRYLDGNLAMARIMGWRWWRRSPSARELPPFSTEASATSRVEKTGDRDSFYK